MSEQTTKRWLACTVLAACLVWPTDKLAAESATTRTPAQLDDFKKIFDAVPRDGNARVNVPDDVKAPLDLCKINPDLPQCKALRE